MMTALAYVRYSWAARSWLAQLLRDEGWAQMVTQRCQTSNEALRLHLYHQRLQLLGELRGCDCFAHLAWRQPDLVRRLLSPSGQIKSDSKALKQAMRVVYGYAIAAMGRMAPRQTWVAQGFAEFATSATPCQPRAHEQTHLEPNVAWFCRAIPSLATTEIEPGEDAWAWLDRASAAVGLCALASWVHKTRELVLVQLVDWKSVCQLQQCVQTELKAIGVDSSDYASALWPSRILKSQLRLPTNVLIRAKQNAEQFFESADATIVHASRAPMPWQLQLMAQQPQAVWAQGEEFWEYVVDRKTASQPHRVSSYAQVGQSALLAQCSRGQVHALGFDPSPGRAASRAALMIGDDYGYLTKGNTLASLRIPPSILDNRVMRPIATRAEVEIDDALQNDALQPLDQQELEVRSTLMHLDLMPHVQRELSSPRYRVAPDFYAKRVDMRVKSNGNYGVLSECGRFYWFDRNAIDAMTSKVHSPLAFAKLLVTIWPQLLSHEWAQLWLDQRQLSFACQSALSYDWLWSQLASVRSSMSLYLYEGEDHRKGDGSAAIVDAQGREIDALLMIRGAMYS